jgi:hypothetical protein
VIPPLELKPWSATLLALGGVILTGLGLYFLFLRPPLLPEDPRFMGTTLSQIMVTTPGLPVWLRRVFWVMGGYMSSAGLLTVYVAMTGFRSRQRGAAVVAGLTGLASIGLMAAVNFMIDSDFKWVLLFFVVPWILSLAFYWSERVGPSTLKA